MMSLSGLTVRRICATAGSSMPAWRERRLLRERSAGKQAKAPKPEPKPTCLRAAHAAACYLLDRHAACFC
jgi:hypothetical protein